MGACQPHRSRSWALKARRRTILIQIFAKFWPYPGLPVLKWPLKEEKPKKKKKAYVSHSLNICRDVWNLKVKAERTLFILNPKWFWIKTYCLFSAVMKQPLKRESRQIYSHPLTALNAVWNFTKNTIAVHQNQRSFLQLQLCNTQENLLHKVCSLLVNWSLELCRPLHHWYTAGDMLNVV